MVGFEVPGNSIAPALFWDTHDPYKYVRLAKDDLLLVGGEDHKVGQSDAPEQRWERLQEWTRARFGQALELG